MEIDRSLLDIRSLIELTLRLVQCKKAYFSMISIVARSKPVLAERISLKHVALFT